MVHSCVFTVFFNQFYLQSSSAQLFIPKVCKTILRQILSRVLMIMRVCPTFPPYLSSPSLTLCSLCVYITCQWRPNEQRDAFHDSEQAQRWGEAAHLHYIHEDSEHQGAHHTHGQPVERHISQQYSKAGPNTADTVTEPVDQQSWGKYINVSPFEPGQVEEDAKGRSHHDVNDTQDGEQQRSLALLHVVCCCVWNQIHQRHHKPKHHPGDADGIHTVTRVITELIKGHVFAQGSQQKAPYCSHPSFFLLLHIFLLWQRGSMVHQRLASMLGGLEGPHHCAAHAAVKKDSPQNKETSPPAQLCVEVVTQER